MSNNVAPSCPISHSKVPAGSPLWARPGSLVDLINSIPIAHDLPSVLRSLNIMTNIINQISRGTPQINNVYPDNPTNIVLKGQDNNPNYRRLDWLVESRNYTDMKLYNPDQADQYIEIKVLTRVTFYNANTAYKLEFTGQG